MSKRAGRGKLAKSLYGIAVLIATLAVGSSAHAANEDCSTLQAALDAATNGSIITLTEMCAGQNGTPQIFSLPSNVSMTLRGTPGAGFDGTGAKERVLTGREVADVVIENLTFRSSGNNPLDERGGALLLVLLHGAEAQIKNSVFEDNAAFSGDPDNFPSYGGAIAVDVCGDCETVSQRPTTATIQGVDFARNIADHGGAVSAVVEQLVVSGARFVNNRAGGSGGAIRSISDRTQILGNQFHENTSSTFGGAVSILQRDFNDEDGNDPMGTLTDNRFTENRVTCGPTQTALGGGLYVASDIDGPRGELRMEDNLFDGNTAGPASNDDCLVRRLIVVDESARKSGFVVEPFGQVGGGGAWLEDVDILSVNDRYENNVVEGTRGMGGGIGVQSTFFHARFVAHNLAVAGNRIIGSTEGKCFDCQILEFASDFDPDPSRSLGRGIGAGI